MWLSLRLLCLGVALGVATSTADGQATQADDWPLFRGDAQSRGVATSELPAELSVLWKFQVPDGAFEGSATIAAGLVFVADMDTSVFALHLSDGKKAWQFASEIGFATAPSYKSGKLYLGDFDGKFYCLDATNGKLLWTFETQAEIDSSANFYKDNVLFGSQDATLYCLNADSGELVWKYTIDDQIRCSPSIIEDRAFVAGCDARLHIIDLEKGVGVGSVDIDGPTGVTPAVDESLVFFGTETGTLFAINYQDEEVQWTFDDGGQARSFRSCAAVGRDVVVVGSGGKRVYGIDKLTGKKLWEFVARKRIDSSPVIVGGLAYVGSADGRLHALDIENGESVWSFEVGGNLSASPAVAGHRLIIASADGVVYCFGDRETQSGGD